MLRDYEKGKQLGAPGSPWVRTEVQFSNHDKVIPLDILIDPSSYFVAAYPCFQRFSPNRTGKRTEVVKRSVEAGVDHYLRHAKRSYGKPIRALRQVYGDEVLLDLIQADTDELPSRLVWPDHQFVSPPIHEAPKPQPISYLELISAAPSFGYRGDVFGFLDSLDQEK
jgi:phage replication initiation protein